jgi:hypothetical protein
MQVQWTTPPARGRQIFQAALVVPVGCLADGNSSGRFNWSYVYTMLDFFTIGSATHKYQSVCEVLDARGILILNFETADEPQQKSAIWLDLGKYGCYQIMQG